MATTVQFDPSGPKIKAEVRCGHAHAGAYILKVWKDNDVVQEEEGTFFDPQDDSYTLKGTTASQDGRLVQCTGTIEVVPPIEEFALLLTLWQGNLKIGSVTASGSTKEPQVSRSLFARLEAK